MAFPPGWSVEGSGGRSDLNKGEGELEECAHELSASMIVDKSADNGGQGEMLLSTGANLKH